MPKVWFLLYNTTQRPGDHAAHGRDLEHHTVPMQDAPRGAYGGPCTSLMATHEYFAALISNMTPATTGPERNKTTRKSQISHLFPPSWVTIFLLMVLCQPRLWLEYCQAWFLKLSFCRITESTTGYTFTPCVGSFTSTDRRDHCFLVSLPKDAGNVRWMKLAKFWNGGRWNWTLSW